MLSSWIIWLDLVTVWPSHNCLRLQYCIQGATAADMGGWVWEFPFPSRNSLGMEYSPFTLDLPSWCTDIHPVFSPPIVGNPATDVDVSFFQLHLVPQLTWVGVGSLAHQQSCKGGGVDKVGSFSINCAAGIHAVQTFLLFYIYILFTTKGQNRPLTCQWQ